MSGLTAIVQKFRSSRGDWLQVEAAMLDAVVVGLLTFESSRSKRAPSQQRNKLSDTKEGQARVARLAVMRVDNYIAEQECS